MENNNSTTDQQLKEITQDTREKLPRLMELTEGCIFTYTNKYKKYIISDYKVILRDNRKIYTLNHYNELEKHYFKNLTKDFKIIGHEPMLNDVLEWYNEFNSYDSYFSGDAFRQRLTKIDDEYDQGFKIDWDLSKPYLKDQSPELINFLYNLLKEKKCTS